MLSGGFFTAFHTRRRRRRINSKTGQRNNSKSSGDENSSAMRNALYKLDSHVNGDSEHRCEASHGCTLRL